MTTELLITIGKILGLSILGILGLVILLLLLVLFVPIRYRITGKKEQDMFVHIKATWLFHIVSVLYSFKSVEEGIVRTIRILGIPIRRSKEKRNTKAKQADSKSDHKQDEVKDEEKSDKEAPIKSNKAIQWEQEAPTQTASDVKSQDAKSKAHASKKKFDFFSKIKMKWFAFLDFCKSIKAKKEHYEKILHSETFIRAFAMCKKELLKAWMHIRPRKVVGNVRFGFEDPSVTGRVLGGVCMLYAFYGDTLSVIPDFEQKIFEGKLFIRGRIRVFTVLLIALRLYKNQDIKHLRSMFKKEEL